MTDKTTVLKGKNTQSADSKEPYAQFVRTTDKKIQGVAFLVANFDQFKGQDVIGYAKRFVDFDEDPIFSYEGDKDRINIENLLFFLSYNKTKIRWNVVYTRKFKCDVRDLFFDFISALLYEYIDFKIHDGKILIVSGINFSEKSTAFFGTPTREMYKSAYIDKQNEPTISKSRSRQASGLQEDEHQLQLQRVYEAVSGLPTGEIERLANTALKRKKKWSGGVPTMAPELFAERPANENLPDFIRRVYGEAGHLTGSLNTAHLDIIDPQLSRAIRNWIDHHGDLPEDINLPNKVTRRRIVKPPENS